MQANHTSQSNITTVKSFSWPRPVTAEIKYLLGASIILVLWINSPYWWRTAQLLDMNNISHGLFLLSQMVLVTGATVTLSLILCWGVARKWVLTLLMVISSVCAYFSEHYQVYFDRHMMTNMMRTDSAEAWDLMSWSLLGWLVVFLVPALAYVWGLKVMPQAKIGKVIWQHIWVSVLVLAVGLSASLPIYKQYASFFRNHKELVKMLTPFNIINANISYAQHRYRDTHQVFEHVGMDAKQYKPITIKQPTVMVVVVGETARADRFALNGYHKPTNPLLAQENGVISFQDASSCGTATAHSVPCMFSDLGRRQINLDQAPMRDNLLDIAQRVGVQVTWIDNNSGCQETCLRIPHEQLRQDCPERLCYDSKLIEALQSHLNSSNPNQDQLVVLHMNGSHGPAYYQRYPKEYAHFAPACNTNAIDTCSQEQLNNVYDNTIVYTDVVLDGIIKVLQQQNTNTLMWYMSDHGESLGEKGLYLHGTPYAIAPQQQTHIPFIVWGNQDFYQQQGIRADCLQQMAKTEAVSQDNLFHSILGGLNVKTQAYDGKLDIFHTCTKAA